MDIAAAQRLLGMYGKLDRIEVFLAPGEDGETVEQLVKATIPDTWEIQTPGARSEENRRMLRAFRWNLRILSYISLLVGAFLIYNTIAVSVVRRRAEIGILRALGTSSRGVLMVFLGEALDAGAGRLGHRRFSRTLSRRRTAGHDLRHGERAVCHQRSGDDCAVGLVLDGCASHGTGVAFVSALIPGAGSRTSGAGGGHAPVDCRT